MKTGTVKWFNSRKGYGFIKPADGGFDVYVHVAAVERAGMSELKEGQKICFEVVTDERTGELQAENLSLAEAPPAEPRSVASGAVAVPVLLPYLGLLAGWKGLR